LRVLLRVELCRRLLVLRVFGGCVCGRLPGRLLAGGLLPGRLHRWLTAGGLLVFTLAGSLPRLRRVGSLRSAHRLSSVLSVLVQIRTT